MLGRRNEAMLNAAIAANLILVGAGVKKSYIQGLFIIIRIPIGIFQFWKKHFINMFFGVVIIMPVAGDAA